MRKQRNFIENNLKPDRRTFFVPEGNPSEIADQGARKQMQKRSKTKQPTAKPFAPSQWAWYFKLRENPDYP